MMIATRVLAAVALLPCMGSDTQTPPRTVPPALIASYQRLLDGYNLVASSTDFSLVRAPTYRNEILACVGGPPVSVELKGLAVLFREGDYAVVRADRVFHGSETPGDSVLVSLKQVFVDDWKIRWQAVLDPWPPAEPAAAGREALAAELKSSLESLLSRLAGQSNEPLAKYLHPASISAEVECRRWSDTLSQVHRPGLTIQLDRFELIVESDRLPMAIATRTTSWTTEGFPAGTSRTRSTAVIAWRKELGGPRKVILCAPVF